MLQAQDRAILNHLTRLKRQQHMAPGQQKTKVASGRASRLLPRALLVALTFVAAAACASATYAQSREYNVKAAYIYNFARYVTWPEVDSEPDFVIGVMGGNPFGNALHKIAVKKTVRGKRIRIREFRSLADYVDCDILFAAQTLDSSALAAITRQTDNRPVLVVAESKGFCESGGTVNFSRTAEGTVGIEINIDALQRRNLRVDAKLLKLARIIRAAGGER